MRIFSEVQYVWSQTQSRYIRVHQKLLEYSGIVAYAKGASDAQNSLANSQSQFYNTLQSDYGKQFAAQGNILSSLQNTLNPIIQAGPNQFGFNAAETNNLNSSAIQNTGQQYNNASQALRANQAAEGGGNALLPSGVQQTQQANLVASAANNTSNQLLGIQNAGYEQGHNQYEQAVGQLGSVASQYNPTGYAGSASTAGNDAFGSATEVNKENQAASPWNIIAPILGGALGTGLSALTGGASSLAGGLSGGFGGLEGGTPMPGGGYSFGSGSGEASGLSFS